MDANIREELARKTRTKDEEDKDKVKDQNDDKVKDSKVVTEEEKEKVSDKDFAEAKKADKARLHEKMDGNFDKIKETLEQLFQKTSLDDYWKMVSKTIENSWIEHLEVDKDTAKKMRGRGEVNIKKKAPRMPNKEEKEGTIRNEFMYKATENLKQARRCEQISHRMMKGKEAEEGKKDKYDELNMITAKGIRKKLDMKDEREQEFHNKLGKYMKKEMEEEMLGPTIKLQTQKYHKEYDKWKKKAVEKQKVTDQKLFNQKGKGHWHLMKSMENHGKAKALIALRRTKRGPMGAAERKHHHGPR
jgi:hypothetical protein